MMAKKIVHGYKDIFAKTSFIATGVIVLVGLNGLFIVWVKYPTIKWRWLGGLAVLGWVFWRMWRIQKKMRYIFSKKGITIHLPNGKEFLLSHDTIISQERIDHLPRWSGRGIKYIPWRKELHFTTSTTHLLKLVMADGRTIYISPKEYI